MTSFNQHIWNAALQAGDSGATAPEIVAAAAAACGIQPRRGMTSTVGQMARRGILVRTGDHRPARYKVARAIMPTGRAVKPRPAKRSPTREQLRQQFLQWRDDSTDGGSINSRIRRVLKQHGPMTAAQIFERLGIDAAVARVHLFPSIASMVNEGMLDLTPGSRPRIYRFVREPMVNHRSQSMVELARKAREARAAERARIRAERIAQQAAEKLERQRQRESRKAMRRQEQERRRIELQALAAERRNKPAPTKLPIRSPHGINPLNTHHLPPPTHAAPSTSVSEDVAAFLAAGGQVEVLPHNFDTPRTRWPGRRPGLI